jgi:hypothetical protein
MLSYQAGAILVALIVYGIYSVKRAAHLRGAIAALPRNRRVGMGVLLLVGSGILLLGGLALVVYGGGGAPEGLTWWGFTLVILLAIVFVRMQVLAALFMASLALESVTGPTREASTKVEHEEP